MAKKTPKRHRLTLASEAKPILRQHRKSCHDCPWRRECLPGWLGGMSPDEWLAGAHGEARVDCHALIMADGSGAQCAGVATYRSNVHKLPHDKTILMLPADRERVFASPAEFKAHHEHKDVPPAVPKKKPRSRAHRHNKSR